MTKLTKTVKMAGGGGNLSALRGGGAMKRGFRTAARLLATLPCGHAGRVTLPMVAVCAALSLSAKPLVWWTMQNISNRRSVFHPACAHERL